MFVEQNFKEKVVNLFFLPCLLLLILYLWFNWIQQGGCEGVCHVEQSIVFEGYAGFIEQGLIRTISHLDEAHLMNNITTVALTLLFLGLLQSWRVTIIQVSVTIIGSIVVMGVYTTTIGFSIVGSSLILISISSYLMKFPLDIERWRTDLDVFLILHLLLIHVLYDAAILVFDLLVVLGYSTAENPGVGEYFVHSLHSSYVPESSEVHIIGAVIGLLISVTTAILSKYVFE